MRHEYKYKVMRPGGREEHSRYISACARSSSHRTEHVQLNRKEERKKGALCNLPRKQGETETKTEKQREEGSEVGKNEREK